MKKNYKQEAWYDHAFKKTFLIMRLVLAILLVCIMQSFALNSYTQNSKISLSVKQMRLEDILRQIESESKYRFAYNKIDINVNEVYTINIEEAEIKDVLTRLFSEKKISYSVIDRQIILSKPEGSLAVSQQSLKVSGRVTDSSGSTLQGVSIIIKGTIHGVITDINGNYSFPNVPDNATLVFSFVGMKTQEIAASGKTSINIQMEEETVGIDEVVAIGYGTMKKSDLTGSIVSVKGEEIARLPVKSVTEALQGRVAGVMINKSSGKPGASSEIIIRGAGSINGLNPLFIIDGISRGNNVTYNPKDVASIEIIKDASAAAIYGAQAAGGVVLITTKKGSYNQKTKIDVSSNIGVRAVSNTYDMLETVPYIRARQAVGDNYGLWNDPESLPNTNWFEELFQTGVEQSHLISLTGGTDKVKYYVSGGYEGEQGVQKGNKWERFSLNANSDYKLGKKIVVGLKIYAAKIMEDPYVQNIPWRTLPFMAVYNEDGTFAKVPAEIEFSGGNDIASLAMHHTKNGTSVLNVDGSFDWEIISGLHFLTTASAGHSAGYNDNFTEADNLRRSPSQASYTKSSSYSDSYVVTATLNYSKIFVGKHDFKALLGYEIKSSNGSSLSASANTFPVDVAESFTLSTNPNKTASGSLSYGRFLSQFARMNYAYDNRYFLTANVRRDGSPKFGPSSRWGVFPSVSAGWKLTEENFFKNIGLTWVTMIKPRVSWGILGNDSALGNFMYKNSYTPIYYHSFDESTVLQGYGSIKVINEDIKWEEIHTANYGIDVLLFDSKLSVNAEYYKRNTKDMIYNLPTPPSSGVGNSRTNTDTSTMPVNIGSIVNKGWELSVSYRDKIGDFRYDIAGNLSHNKNQVIDLGLPTAYIYGSGAGFPFSGTQPFKTVNSRPLGQIYGFQTDGLIRDQAQIDQLNSIAKEKYEAANPGKSSSSIFYWKKLSGPGDLLFRDIDGDGRITDADRTFIGNPWPKLQYGLNFSLGYKNVDLYVDFVGVYGLDVLNLTKSNEENFAQDYQSTEKIFNASLMFGNSLTGQPTLGRVDPATGYFTKDPNLNYSSYSDYFVEDGSYLKIKNISVGYTLPVAIVSKLRMDNIRIYLTGQNLFTFTKFSGLDPEFSNDVKNHGLYKNDTYPQTKLYSIGLNLTF